MDQVLQREMDADGDGVIEDIQVYAQNPRGDVVGLVVESKGGVCRASERVRYSAFAVLREQCTIKALSSLLITIEHAFLI